MNWDIRAGLIQDFIQTLRESDKHYKTTIEQYAGDNEELKDRLEIIADCVFSPAESRIKTVLEIDE